jgi:Carboxypeptidase A inhibitor
MVRCGLWKMWAPARVVVAGRTLPRRQLGVAGAVLFLLCGCWSGSLGDTCSGESDCPYGTRCFQPKSSATKICTVSCSSSPCDNGTCVMTADGQVCAKACASAADCGGSTLCQATPEQVQVCWVATPNASGGSGGGLTPINTGIVVASVTPTTQYISGTGELAFNIFVKNTGATRVQSIGAQIVCGSAYVSLDYTNGCVARSSYNSQSCPVESSSECTCYSIAGNDYLQSLDPGQTSDPALVTIVFTLKAGAPTTPIPFTITFTDPSSDIWTDTFEVQP